MAPLVTALVLNYRQAKYVPHCLNALMRQTYPDIEIIFIDNASGDGSVEYVRDNYPQIDVIANSTNLYFAKGHNIGIQRSSGDYIMPLNVDVVLERDFIAETVRAMELDCAVGMVSGKLLQMDSELIPLEPPVIDSTGLWFSPQMRHFDRGSQQPDRGQYDCVEYVWGPSGAAPLYRRDMLEDVAFQGEYFDEDFVMYREDADMAWRAQLLGWKGLYTPFAVGFHVRRVRPTDQRTAVSSLINMHSVKNRFLMRVKNQTWRNALRFFLPMCWRDLQVIGYVLLIEHSSLGAFVKVLRSLPRTVEKRRHIMTRRRVDDRYIASWFSYMPTSLPYAKKGIVSKLRNRTFTI